MSSPVQSTSHCKQNTCLLQRPHCHICDNEACGFDRPHCHGCENDENDESQEDLTSTSRPDLATARNNTQPGSIQYQERLLGQDSKELESDSKSNSTQTIIDQPRPEIVYHLAEWQPSYAVGGGADLTKMLTPTSHHTFSWGGPGSNVVIPSPELAPSVVHEPRVHEGITRPPLGQARSSRVGEMMRRRIEDGPVGNYGLESGVGFDTIERSESAIETGQSARSGSGSGLGKAKRKGKARWKGLKKVKEDG